MNSAPRKVLIGDNFSFRSDDRLPFMMCFITIYIFFFFSSYRKWQLTELFPSISSHLVAIKETILSRANMKKLKFKLKHNHHNSYLFYGFSSLFFFKFIIMLLILVNLFNINRLKKSLLSFRLLFF